MSHKQLVVGLCTSVRWWLFGLCGLDYMALVKNLVAQDFMNIDFRINVWLSLWRCGSEIKASGFRCYLQKGLAESALRAELSETCLSWDESSSMLHTHLSQGEEGYEIICLFSKKGKSTINDFKSIILLFALLLWSHDPRERQRGWGRWRRM